MSELLPRFTCCAAILLQCAIAAAQTAVAIRFEPKPNQIVQVSTTQKFTVRMNENEMLTESRLSYRQANAQFDSRGFMESQLTIEEVELRQALNGAGRPPSELGKLQGRVLTAVFDRQGKLTDLNIPKDLQQAATVLRQLVAGAYGVVNFLPLKPMSVGETARAPSTVPLRLPGGKQQVLYRTRTVTTLRGVDRKNGDLVARLEQRIESEDTPSQVAVSGTGTIEVNLDRGFVSNSDTEWSFSGDSANVTGNEGSSGMVRGAVRVTVAAHEPAKDSRPE